MTAPRMFYTDPLKAAIMARDFGVKFHVDNSEKPVPIWVFGRWLENRWDKIAVVAADSEHIFQPQVGDIVVFSADDGSLCVDAVEQVYFDGDESYPYTGDSGTVIQLCASHPDWLHARKARIIQRNGKAFFMPEKE